MNKVLKNKYNEIRSGWAIIVGLAFFVSCIILVNVLMGFFPSNLKGIANVLIYVGLAVCLFYILHLFYKKKPYAMGFTRKKVIKNLIYGALTGFLSISLVFIILVATNNVQITSIDLNSIFTFSFFSAFLGPLSVAIGEEALFRSYIMTSLKTTRSKVAIISISSIIFSLFHSGNPGSSLLPLINVALFGVLFAFLLIKIGNVWFLIAYHAIWNFCQGFLYGFLVSGNNENMSVFKVSTQGNSLINGGDFGPEGGIVVTILLVISILLVHLFVKPSKDKECWKMDN